MNLQETYTQLLLEIGFTSTEIPTLWLALEKNYTQKSRYYHNLTHLEEMVFSFSLYKQELEHPNEVLYSIFYHDYIYKVTKTDNELKSAQYAISLLKPDYKINKELVFDMILATQNHLHHIEEDCNWLIDFDLKVLSKNEEQYKRYTQEIRDEYKIYPDILYNPARKKALHHFLTQPSIYQTQEFQSLFEDKARENMENEIQQL
ncbi:hypothetical protein NAT47_07230 [Flavobacterium sp. HXWNR69]|uniref:Metal-dependent HD superfamily phosphohydrolase n=1 Tax=Flavobacterium fragile TaxID=2949085 RepID=A0ABT0TIF8_9FLAO|nr:hypothetical protein [Flavobacterium sp. HXWNR69]MCL9770205.1 hypothetical protein [Flavobacterium sp. HXWNR69]